MRTLKIELEKQVKDLQALVSDKVLQLNTMSGQLSTAKNDIARKELTMDNMETVYKQNFIENDKRHELAIAKRDDYVKRVLDRIEGVKALLHVPIQEHDVNFMNSPGMEQLKAEWNKGTNDAPVDRVRY